MKIQYGNPSDIEQWMELVKKMRDLFPGLETEEAIEEHKKTVLSFMACGGAICAKEKDTIIGVLLFSYDECMICYLAVDPEHRRCHVAREMFFFAIEEAEHSRDVIVTTYTERDANGKAARAFYKKMGFSPEETVIEFGVETQVFRLHCNDR